VREDFCFVERCQMNSNSNYQSGEILSVAPGHIGQLANVPETAGNRSSVASSRRFRMPKEWASKRISPMGVLAAHRQLRNSFSRYDLLGRLELFDYCRTASLSCSRMKPSRWRLRSASKPSLSNRWEGPTSSGRERKQEAFQQGVFSPRQGSFGGAKERS
jgi:hypothetical protein